MLKRFTLFTLLVCACLTAKGQAYLKESNNWYFGDNAGMVFYPYIQQPSFNGNPKTIDSAQALNADEGSAAMSDTSGKLLFYVGTHDLDGGLGQSTVFNRNHEVMPNGREAVIGGSSSTQNAIVIRQPGNFRYYYIFSVAQQENTAADGQGFYYTVVDMEADNGLGAVVDSLKSKEILRTTTEKVTAVLHRNGRDVWIMTHENGTNRFCAVLLSPDGVSTPVFTSIGLSHGTGNNARTNLRGGMKFSPNGNRVAVAITEDIGGVYYMQTFRFNNLTGEVFEPITFRSPYTNGVFGPYGVEFSPNNSKVYFSNRSGTNRIFQYDLCAGTGDSADIVNSKYEITTTYAPTCLQLGLNGRIYIARGGSVINYIANPNEAGAACMYNATGIQLASGTTADRGLTNVNQSIFNSLSPKVEYIKLCENDETEFAAQAECQGVVARYYWNFGDPESGALNVDSTQFPRHRFTRPGVYSVFVYIDAGNLVDSARINVTITPRPRGTIIGDQVSCKVLTQYNYIQDTTDSNLSPRVTNYFWRLVGPTTDSSYQGVAYNQILYPFDSNQTVEVRAVAYSTTELGELCPSDTARLSVIVNQRKGATPTGLDTVCLDPTVPYVLNSSDSPRGEFRWLITPRTGIDTTIGALTSTQNIFFTTSGRRTARVDGFKDIANQVCYTPSDPFNFYISESPADEILIFGDSSICQEGTVRYRAYGGRGTSTYAWGITYPTGAPAFATFDATAVTDTLRLAFNPDRMREGDNIYFLTGQEVSKDGCKGPVTSKMLYNNCVQVPNLITPNNDQMNDDFYVTNASRYNDNELELYNRWGRTVYKKTGFANDLKGSDLQPGTYFYRFRANVEGVQREFKGWMEVAK